MIDGSRLNLSAPRTSSLKNTLLKSGRVKTCVGALSIPRAQAKIVTRIMAARNANGFFRDIRNTEIPIPTIVSSAGFPNAPSFTSVTGSETIKPAFLNPMNVRKIPMPAAAAILISFGIALAIDSRTGVTEIKRKKTPAQKMIPSAVGHRTPLLKTMV